DRARGPTPSRNSRSTVSSATSRAVPATRVRSPTVPRARTPRRDRRYKVVSEGGALDAVVQLTRAGTVLRTEASELARLREQFTQRACLKLLCLTVPRQPTALLDAIDRWEFYERVHPNAGSPPPVDWCLRNDRVSGE